jgi:TetR/AcrR family transcriptional regulator, ethionamide resistance regulator
MVSSYQRGVDLVNGVLRNSTACKVSAVTTAHPTRGRRTLRPSGDDRQLAILDTAERLLGDRPLAEISVDDLARGAGISRPTFYFYFASKDAVLLTLFERVIVEADTALEKLVSNPPDDRMAIWRTGINVFVETFGSHRTVSLAADASRTGNREIRDLWTSFMEKWIAHITAVIDAERSRGAAPVTLPSRDLAAALNLMNERVMSSAFAGDALAVPESRLLDTLVHVWVGAIYGDSR